MTMNLDAVIASVRKALDAKVGAASNARPAAYEDLLNSLKNAVTPRDVGVLFRAIAQNAAVISRNHEKFGDLLGLVFLYDWTFGPEVSSSFKAILCGLVSSNAGFLEPVLNQLVQNFFPLAAEDEAVEETEKKKGKEEEAVREEKMAVQEGRARLVHDGIRSILNILPFGCNGLLPVLIAQFPKRGDSLERHMAFIRESLEVCQYVPVIRDRIIALTFEGLLKMDCEVRLEDLNTPQPTADEIFEMDADEPYVDKAMKVQKLQQRHMIRVQEIAEKLDQILSLILDYSDAELNRGPRMARTYFDLMLNIFDRLILRNRMAKFVQFVQFYICRKKVDFVDRFIERLLQRALGGCDGGTVQTVQLCASSYLASFLSRGLYIKPDSTRSALQHMSTWIHEYDENFDTSYRQRLSLHGGYIIDPEDHAQFFSVCHAIVYALMFKGEDLSRDQLEELDLGVIFNSVLKPFVFFSPGLYEELIRFIMEKSLIDESVCEMMTTEYNDFESILSRKKEDLQLRGIDFRTSNIDEHEFVYVHYRTSSTRQVSATLSEHYPFDPCLLRRVAERINPFYQHWLSKQRKNHKAEYVFCGKGVEEDTFLTDEEDAADFAEAERRERELQDLERSQGSLPTPVQIPGLSQRAARMLHHLGAGSSILGGLRESSYDILSSIFAAPASAASSPGSYQSEASSIKSGALGHRHGPLSQSMQSSSPMSLAGSYGARLPQRFLVERSAGMEDLDLNDQVEDSAASRGIPIPVVNKTRAPSIESGDGLSGSW